MLHISDKDLVRGLPRNHLCFSQRLKFVVTLASVDSTFHVFITSAFAFQTAGLPLGAPTI